MSEPMRVVGVGPFDVPPQATTSGFALLPAAVAVEWFFVTEGDADGLFLWEISWNNQPIVLVSPPVAATVFQVRDMADILQLRDVDEVQAALQRWRVDFGTLAWGDQVKVQVQNRTDRWKRFSAAFVGRAEPGLPL